jgi:hypothetical protein
MKGILLSSLYVSLPFTSFIFTEGTVRLRDPATLRTEMGSAMRGFAESILLVKKHASTILHFYQDASGVSKCLGTWCDV